MAGGTPPRHGLPWDRQAPTPIVPNAEGLPKSFPGGGSGGASMPPAGKTLVSVIDAFVANLPAPAVQQVSRVIEAPFKFDSWINDDGTLKGTPQLTLEQFVIPSKYVYIFTNVKYYAMCPSRHIEGSLSQLDDQQLAGIMRFVLMFNGVAPMRQEVSIWTTTAIETGPGFSILNSDFGAMRTLGFALFARSQQTVKIVVQIDAIPRFAISKLGAQLHGIAIPEALFEGIFEKRRG